MNYSNLFLIFILTRFNKSVIHLVINLMVKGYDNVTTI